MAGNLVLRKFSRWVLAGFFVGAGANHFINPAFYFPLIPDYLPFHWWINFFSGLLEIVLGLGLLSKRTQTFSSFGIIILMVLFIPAHVYFIQRGNCVESLCIEPWIGWARLIVIHPLLILWAFSHRNE